MSRGKSWAVVCVVAGWLGCIPGCEADGVGDPCVPEDEYSDTFSGFALSEISVESRSFQCQSRVCMVNHFQGRVSCPYGQEQGQAGCTLPGGSEPVHAVVKPQLLDRRADDAVYCSCRCAGDDPSAHYCECPSGFTCSKVVQDFALGMEQLAGSYCVRSGSEYVPAALGPGTCDAALANCDSN